MLGVGFGVEYLGVVEAEDLLVVGVDLLHAGEGGGGNYY